jgi:N-acetylneuraminate lyase
VTGSTGEGIYLDFDLRRRIVEIAARLSRDRGTLIVHVGAVQASQVVELAEHAGRVGADAVSSIPPFAGGYAWDEVLAYYTDLASRSPLPVVAYHIPMLTGQPQPIANLAAVLEIPGVVGLKYTAPDFYAMQRLLGRLRLGQVLYNGQDEALAAGLLVGARGGIGTTYNFMPELILEIAREAEAGRFAEAMAAQRRANDIIEPLLCFQTLAATKQILVWQGLIQHATCAFPRAGLNELQQGQLREMLATTAIAQTLVR